MSLIDVELLEGGLLPAYATDGAAGADLHARLERAITVQPGEIVKVPCGIKLAIPAGYEVQIRPRSGLAARFGLTVLNAPGTIDSDYRGEVVAILIHHGKEPFAIEPQMRIAQMVVAAVTRATLRPCELLSTTARGEGGFGHTGLCSRTQPI